MQLLSLPGEGLRYQLAPGNEVLCKLTTEQSWNMFEVYERTVAPRTEGDPLHLHREAAEMFYVVRGTATFQLGPRTEVCPPGTLCVAPRNVPHAFRNDGEEELLVYCAMAPGCYQHERFASGEYEKRVTEVGTREGYVSMPGEGPVYPFEPESIVRYKLLGEDTFGQIEAYEREVPANCIGADPHVHYSNVEVFYVTQGHVVIQIHDRRVSYAPGSVVVAPLTSVNGFKNDTDKPCKLLIFFTPSRNHHLYFQGMADLKHGDPAHYAAGLAELRKRFDSDTAYP